MMTFWSVPVGCGAVFLVSIFCFNIWKTYGFRSRRRSGRIWTELPNCNLVERRWIEVFLKFSTNQLRDKFGFMCFFHSIFQRCEYWMELLNQAQKLDRTHPSDSFSKTERQLGTNEPMLVSLDFHHWPWHLPDHRPWSNGHSGLFNSSMPRWQRTGPDQIDCLNSRRSLLIGAPGVHEWYQ